MRKKLTDYATRKLKDSIMNPNPNTDKNAHADTVIRNHVLWSMGASYVIPLPFADIFAVSALQLDMIRQLCRVYDVNFAETQGKAIVSALTTSAMTSAGVRSLLKVIPVVGTIVGGLTVAVFNGASTFALGQVFKRHFGSGGTILDFDTERLTKLYKEQFEKGKQVAKEWKNEVETKAAPAPPPPPPAASDSPFPSSPEPTVPPATAPLDPEPAPFKSAGPQPGAEKGVDDETLRKLRELAEMKAQLIITEEEFELMKKRLIGG